MRLFYRCFDFVPKEFGVIPLYDNCVCGYKTQITPCPNKTEFSVKPVHSVPHPRITHLLERLLYFVKKCKSITVENIQIEHLNVINNDNQWPYSCTPGGLK